MSDYDTPIDERIDDHDWYCDTHGEIDTEHLTISISGQLLCKMCEVATISSPNSDIDATVTSKSDPRWNKNETAVSPRQIDMESDRGEVLRFVSRREHDGRDERGEQFGIVVSLNPYLSGISV